MSRIDSRKELNSVYRRCLSALNQSYKLRQPSVKKCKEIEAKVAEEVKAHKFANAKMREKWVKNRIDELYNEELSKLFKDPHASLKAWIESLVA